MDGESFNTLLLFTQWLTLIALEVGNALFATTLSATRSTAV